MLYKTIALELLKEQTVLHDQLKAAGGLLPALNLCSLELKASHERWKQRLTRPGSQTEQVASAALELAIEELRIRLPTALPPKGQFLLSEPDRPMSHD